MDKIIVGLKRVVDYNVRVQVKSDGSGVETDGVKMSINPFDEIALEEALRIKERGEASEVVAVSIGSSEAQQQLRTGLAMGADRAILVKTDEGHRCALSIARIFKAHRGTGEARILYCSENRQSTDDSSADGPDARCHLGADHRPRLRQESRLTGTPRACTREVDAGLETIEVDLPAVISADLATQRAALRQAARHHEGQEKAAGRSRPWPTSECSGARRSRNCLLHRRKTGSGASWLTTSRAWLRH